MFLFLAFAFFAIVIVVLYVQYCKIFSSVFHYLAPKRIDSRRFKAVPKAGPTATASRIRPLALDEVRKEGFGKQSSMYQSSEHPQRPFESRQAKKRTRLKQFSSKADDDIGQKLLHLRSILSCGIDHEPIEIVDDLCRFVFLGCCDLHTLIVSVWPG